MKEGQKEKGSLDRNSIFKRHTCSVSETPSSIELLSKALDVARRRALAAITSVVSTPRHEMFKGTKGTGSTARKRDVQEICNPGEEQLSLARKSRVKFFHQDNAVATSQTIKYPKSQVNGPVSPNAHHHHTRMVFYSMIRSNGRLSPYTYSRPLVLISTRPERKATIVYPTPPP